MEVLHFHRGVFPPPPCMMIGQPSAGPRPAQLVDLHAVWLIHNKRPPAGMPEAFLEVKLRIEPFLFSFRYLSKSQKLR